MSRVLLPLCLVSLIALALGVSPALAQNKPLVKKAAKPAVKPHAPVTRPTDIDLIEALENENIPRVMNLLRRGANPNASSDGGIQTALNAACALGNLKLVKEFLNRGAKVNAENPDANSPLQTALALGFRDIGRLLIGKGANVNVSSSGSQGPRPLELAVLSEDLPLVTLILDKGADINHAGEAGETALTTAAATGKVSLLELLIARGAKIDPVSDKNHLLLGNVLASGSESAVDFVLSKGYTLSENPQALLPHAIQSNKPAIIQKLLDAGADLEAMDENGDTALMIAVQEQRAAAVTFLLKKKARFDRIDRHHKTALELAEENPFGDRDETARSAILSALKKAGAKPVALSLWRAVIDGELKPLQHLLNAGADPNLRDQFQEVPLFYAITQGRFSEKALIVEALLKKGANPNARTSQGQRLIDLADENSGIPSLLRRAGAETPERDLTDALEKDDRATAERILATAVVPEPDALLVALAKKDMPLMDRLLAKGANINGPLRSRRGGPLFRLGAEYPLQAAVRLEDSEMVRVLLDKGADPNWRIRGGMTPLQSVSGKNEAATDTMVHLLIERGAKIPSEGPGTSALVSLAGTVSAKTLAFVLENGGAADIQAKNEELSSPLLAAMRGNKPENVRLLLEHGANPEGTTEYNESALLELVGAKETPKAVEIAKLLIAAGARLDIKNTFGETPLQLARQRSSRVFANLIEQAGGKAPLTPEITLDTAINNGDIATVKKLLNAGYSPNGKIQSLGSPPDTRSGKR